MSGQWPPEWEDSDTGLPDEWDIDDAGLDLESSAVTSFLASVPRPVLPAAFEARISAAIAAEATARANGIGSADTESTGLPAGTGSTGVAAVTGSTGTVGVGSEVAAGGPVDAKTTDRSSSPEGLSPAAVESGSGAAAGHPRRRGRAASRGAARGSGSAGSRPNGRRRRLRMPSPAVGAPLLVLLFIAGFAVLITRFSGGSSSSSSGLAGGAASGSSSQGTSYGPNSQSLGVRSLKFVVTESGISYQRSTLARQVQTQLNAQNAVIPAASAPSPMFSGRQTESGATPAAPPIATTPSVNLRGCVSNLTKGLMPSLVEEGRYDGILAYIIAVPGRVWVVRIGCTAANPEKITSVSLPG